MRFRFKILFLPDRACLDSYTRTTDAKGLAYCIYAPCMDGDIDGIEQHQTLDVSWTTPQLALAHTQQHLGSYPLVGYRAKLPGNIGIDGKKVGADCSEQGGIGVYNCVVTQALTPPH